MPNIRFDIPFNQKHILQHISKKPYSDITKKLTQVKNLSSIKKGICRGLSKNYLLHENSNQGDEFIESINSSLRLIKKNKLILNKIEHYKNNSLKKFNQALLNVHIVDSLNYQINYSKSFYLGRLSSTVPLLKFPKREEMMDNLEYIKLIINKNKNNKSLIKQVNIIELIEIYYKKIQLDNDDLIKSIDIGMELSEEIKLKLVNNINLDFAEVKEFLKHTFVFLSQYNMHKSTAKKLNAGMINNKDYPINYFENIHYYPDEITLTELRKNVEVTTQDNHDFLSLISIIGHCMAISIKKCNIAGKYAYHFFDPNVGIKKFNNINDFFDNLEELLEYSTGKNIKNRNESNELIIKLIPMEKTNDNKLPPTFVNQESLNNHVIKSLISDKVTIKIPNGYNFRIESHESKTNTIRIKINNKKQSSIIEIQENNIHEIINNLTEHTK